MTTMFAHDLRIARRKAGLSQRDLARLLETGDKEVSALENGKRLPSLSQTCKLALIYNRSFESLYKQVRKEAKHALFQQLPALPESNSGATKNFNRDATLKRLEERLAGDLTAYHGAA